MSYFDSDMLYLKNGGRWEFWVSQVDIVERYVKSVGKELIQIHVAETNVSRQEPKAAAAGKVILWDPTRGGMRMPHLHYAGEIYILSEGQWADFGKTAMKALVEKMGKMQKITFENVMQVSEALA
jgi:hypothetical protein